MPEPPVRVQFVTAAVALPLDPFDGHRACPAAATVVEQLRPVNGAERAGIQCGDVR